MSHFANVQDGVVTTVIVVPDEQEANAAEFLSSLGLEGNWLQTSYNTYGGVHLAGGQPLRKNFAGVGYTYDETRDAFIPPKTYPSWVLNEETCLWDPPYPKPEGIFYWDERLEAWVGATPDPIIEQGDLNGGS